MGINYLTEINSVHDREFNHPLSATAFKMLMKLYFMANKEGFPKWVKISNALLASLVGCSVKSLIEAREQLTNGGWIVYDGGRRITPRYSICYFSADKCNIYNYSGNNEGNNTGNNTGNHTGNNEGDMSIDKTRDKGDENKDEIGDPEEANENNHLPEDVRAREGSVCGNGTETPGAEQLIRRDELLARHGMCVAAGIEVSFRSVIDSEAFNSTFTTPNQRLTAARMLRDGLENEDMRVYAVEFTMRRAAQAPLGNPIAYAWRLLESWEENGITSIEELEEAKQRGEYCFGNSASYADAARSDA